MTSVQKPKFPFDFDMGFNVLNKTIEYLANQLNEHGAVIMALTENTKFTDSLCLKRKHLKLC
mgnify:CR=1 FL=1